MNWVTRSIKPIMLVSGALTCTMFYAALDPEAALIASFGDALHGPLAQIVVRNWGVLITLVGALLIYGAFHPTSRAPILLVAGASKLAFISLVLAFGDRYLGQQVGIALLIDGLTVVLFALYLSNRLRALLAARSASAQPAVTTPA